MGRHKKENIPFFGNKEEDKHIDEDIFNELDIEFDGDTAIFPDKTEHKKEELLNPQILKSIDLKKEDSFSPVIKDLEDMNERLAVPKNPVSRFFFLWRKDKIKREIEEAKKTAAQVNEKETAKNADKAVKTLQNIIKRKGLLDIEGWKNEFRDSRQPGKTLLVNMELRNGFHSHFMIVLSDKWFDYEDGRYIIDDTYKYYSISSKLWCLDYHQDCSIPIKRRVDMNEIMEAVSRSQDIDTETSINPKSLKIFMESDIIQKVMKGAEMENWIKFVKLMLIIILVINAIILLLFLKNMFG